MEDDGRAKRAKESERENLAPCRATQISSAIFSKQRRDVAFFVSSNAFTDPRKLPRNFSACPRKMCEHPHDPVEWKTHVSMRPFTFSAYYEL